ncbi:unnamed protein product [Bursaphelenchus okinawaensis]|uniref:EamA domain-containing protein n=1 Tax=Bursaphelenchus okinawaensis TaxID=465554 RepID=A0A811JZK5_9BILA|nr:unnamed protein product [Bursaphelenchus okinawaensis]CAG9088302.1 unnamed protein product [Bursaphelenchus okinawaensis]
MPNNETLSDDNDGYDDQWVGFLLLLVACASFGAMFVPLRKQRCKDGFFVQWVQCAVVFCCGFVIYIVRDFPPFDPIAIIGGFLYATGNIFSVPIIESELGVGLGMLIWTTVQIIVGWCIARFGMFGTKTQEVKSLPLNYIGLGLTLISGILFVMVKGEKKGHTNNEERKETTSRRFITKAKLFYIGLAVTLGLLHGCMLTPIVYIQDNKTGASNHAIDYLFVHFSSTFFFSTVYFVVYCLVRRTRAVVNVQLVGPSVLYGLLWTLGMSLFIISNRIVSQTVSFPIATRLPAIIGALIDVFIFKTIKGKQNFIVLSCGIFIGVVGVVLVGISNQL